MIKASSTLAVAVGIAAAASGCGGSSTPPRVQAAALGLTGRPIVAEREVAAQAAAQEKLIASCMNAAGFTYEKASLEEITLERQQSVSQPYGFRSRAAVARSVRGDASITEEVPAIRRRDAYRKTLSMDEIQAFQKALNGPYVDVNKLPEVKLPDGSSIRVGVGGCQGEAQRKLYGDVVAWKRAQSVADYVRIKTVKDTIDDPKFKAAASAWAKCAEAKGLNAKTPFAARNNANRKTSTQQDRIIDVIWSCEQASRVVETGLMLERGYAMTATAKNEREILAYREFAVAASERTRRVLSQSE